MIITPLRQRHVETFVKKLREDSIDLLSPYAGLPVNENGNVLLIHLVERHGMICRAAAMAGMLNGIDPDDLEPWQADDLCSEVIRAVGASLSRPKAFSLLPTSTPTAAEIAPLS